MPTFLTQVFAMFLYGAGFTGGVSDLEQQPKFDTAPVADLSTMVTKVHYSKKPHFVPQKNFSKKTTRTINIYLTGYSFWDNTPRGSAIIARPVVHRQAGGTGTYDDPVTVAVGHTKKGGRSLMDYPTGTRFYFPNLQKYGIVEDLCGDGNDPQNGPCHSGYRGLPWLDIYVGGRSISPHAADRCMRSITGVQRAVLNPPRGYRVSPGEISTSTCRAI